MSTSDFMTLADFRAQCPEFAKASDAIVQTALDQAQTRTSATVFDTLTQEAHKYLTCHILATSPSGRGAALSKQRPDETLYSVARARLEGLVSAGYGIVPDPPGT